MFLKKSEKRTINFVYDSVTSDSFILYKSLEITKRLYCIPYTYF